ncbi:uncharacterized protein NECHADRAFT_86406 [Fusarium vanettenii 77-13-4]|uniref:Uncharacterized protein n=1 Tax=Fusarium vanettenii (strain ATCC MYA-4622 / CBS 123669 / FGSC 9596 / NRRL 45880 / 77-13-4) TaxID=660122 RepID=C7ZF65_FUSV7|nr:uncharacterized protein NECHADRAFT_86406 [Fusarium vanettenii 77-13-4]EEU37514.1 predicted protein [Fusarium vanettenii 77-13-4]
MPLMKIVVALLARLQPSLSLLPPDALRIVNPLSKLTVAVGLGSRAAAIGTRFINLIRAFPTTLTSLSTAKAGVKQLADRFPVLKSWQFWATIFTAASLFFAGLAFWTSFEAGQYAKWTAHKDFTLLCMEEKNIIIVQIEGRSKCRLLQYIGAQGPVFHKYTLGSLSRIPLTAEGPGT